MEQCVMTPGIMKMPLWSADSWVSQNMVSTNDSSVDRRMIVYSVY